MKLCAVLFMIVSAASLAAQYVEGIPDLIPEMRDGVMMMPSTERALEHYGFALTADALESALHDPRPEVRSLAADKLARLRKKDAVPALVEAFSTESAPGTQMWMARALATLGDGRGLPTVRGLCGDTDDTDPVHRAAVRLFAANFMRLLGREACYDDVVDTLRYLTALASRSAIQESFVDYGISLVPSFRNLSAHQTSEIRELAEALLGDRSEARLVASDLLGRYGDAGSALKLKKALASEREVTARSRMETALRALEPKEPSTPTDKK
jgi:HEAT repeat protein